MINDLAPFAPGDVVRRCSGGPPMIVTMAPKSPVRPLAWAPFPVVECAWADERGLQFGRFPPALLRAVVRA